MLGRVQLTDRANDFCRQFSGGMKRRLSVAMSTVGDVSTLVSFLFHGLICFFSFHAG
jgi:ABC-type multidrug transport system ATPase subunit